MLDAPRTVPAVEFVAGPPAVAPFANVSAKRSVMSSGAPNATLDKARERGVRVDARPGDLWIELDQPRGRLVALLLEPHSSSCLFRLPDYFPLVSAGKALPIYRVPR